MITSHFHRIYKSRGGEGGEKIFPSLPPSGTRQSLGFEMQDGELKKHEQNQGLPEVKIIMLFL